MLSPACIVTELHRIVRRLFRLTACEWALLGAALVLVALVRLGLYLLPFRILRGAAGHAARLGSKTRQRVTPQQVAWAVRTASRCIPRATCLTQALAAQTILAALGVSATLRIGVAPGEDGRLDAHAWLEHGDRIVVGWETRQRFTAFPPIEAANS